MPTMEKSYDIHENIYTLSNILHSYVRETDVQIKALEKSAHLLAHGQDVNDGAGLQRVSPTDQDEGETSDEAIIHELEKARLSLVMQIQEENFVSQKLNEMVHECEDLVGGVTSYYNNIHENTQQDRNNIEEYLQQFSDTIDPTVRETLQKNISRLKISQSKLFANAREVLDNIEHDESTLSTSKTQQELSSVIDVLNEKFKFLVEKST